MSWRSPERKSTSVSSEQRRVAVERLPERAALDCTDLTAQQFGDALGDVEVGGEVAPLGHDHAALRACAHDRRHQPEEADGCGVGDQHLAG